MYSLLEYSKNYSKTSDSLWNYYRDKLTDEANDNNGPKQKCNQLKVFKVIRQVLQEVFIMSQLLLKAMMQRKKTQKS